MTPDNLDAPRAFAIDPELAAALVRAQKRVHNIREDARNAHHGYAYTSAEYMAWVGGQALNAEGVALVRIDGALRDGDTLRSTFAAVHESGAALQFALEVPVVAGKGRPVDKATLGAYTAAWGYAHRDLLDVPRTGSDGYDISAREDREDAAPVQGNDDIKGRL